MLAFRERPGENYLIPIDDEPMIRIVEARLRMAKRIDDIVTIVRKGEEKKFSLHVSNPLPVKARTRLEALLKALPPSGEVFLLEGNRPLVMPFLINYLSTLFLDSEADALIPVWPKGEPEVFHAFYKARALRSALEAMMADRERRPSALIEYIDAETVDIGELSRRNTKVHLSFFRVRGSEDLRALRLLAKGKNIMSK
ncbi:hypothetical protein PYCH_17310 [Pyrococcus yayanosii CH1]|uniref:MobA-like NTP transferase domain-containing protein n=1 Tax=Pyrococcus yayanosii (strain CH1 / JCM 16557) TaxID=529709 RepID=F8AHL9_PYRYC|nr:hypothetical protein PYCH_17310 [Pyrococcus yayanosii CH1]